MKPATNKDMSLISESANAIVAGTIAKSNEPKQEQLNESAPAHSYSYTYNLNLTNEQKEAIDNGDVSFILEQINNHFTGNDYTGDGELRYKHRKGI